MSPHDQPSVPLASLEDVTVCLGQRRFGPFDLTIRVGERLAILGPSGAGKSTLLKLLARELHPHTGQACLCDRPLKNWALPELSAWRAVLPQSHEVAFGLPTELVIGLGRVARPHDPDIRTVVHAAAYMACADHLLDRRFDTLSGGEKARVQLARVFAQLWDRKGGLLLVDEPLAALDPGLQLGLLEAILDFARQRNHAVVAILHDINQALQGFDRLLLVKAGAMAGDVPCTVDVLPHLEQLYDVRLDMAVGAMGTLIVAPVRSVRTRQESLECLA